MPYQAIFMVGCGCDVENLGPAMLVYPKITHEVMSYQAIFILGCGCNVKNLGPAMLVYQNTGHTV